MQPFVFFCRLPDQVFMSSGKGITIHNHCPNTVFMPVFHFALLLFLCFFF